MKKIFERIVMITAYVVVAIFGGYIFFGVGLIGLFGIKLSFESCTVKPNPDNWHTVLPYESQYTEEDHVQRICDRLETTSNRRGENFDVYILYSFNDKPEYYLIQKYIIKHNEDGYLTKTYSSFFIGYIENDEYYVPGSELGGIMEGENYYSKADVLNGKKYFASPKQFAWEVDGKFYGYEVMIEGSIHPHVTENIIEISNSIIEKGRKPLSVWKTAITKL